jgi:hypothetical protein
MDEFVIRLLSEKPPGRGDVSYINENTNLINLKHETLGNIQGHVSTISSSSSLLPYLSVYPHPYLSKIFAVFELDNKGK